jgi:hypothetical protein
VTAVAISALPELAQPVRDHLHVPDFSGRDRQAEVHDRILVHVRWIVGATVLKLVTCDEKTSPLIAVVEGMPLGDAAEEHSGFLEGVWVGVKASKLLKRRAHRLSDQSRFTLGPGAAAEVGNDPQVESVGDLGQAVNNLGDLCRVATSVADFANEVELNALEDLCHRPNASRSRIFRMFLC